MTKRREVSRRGLRYLFVFAAVLVIFAGNLAANGIIASCDLTGGGSLNNSCYSSVSDFGFTSPLTVDWGTAFGPADYNAANPSAGSLTTLIGGVRVTMSVGGDYSAGTAAGTLARMDSSYYVWDPTIQANNLQQFAFDPYQMLYGGHFNAPSVDSVQTDSDHLLALYNGPGSIVVTFDKGVSRAGLLLSAMGNSFNMDFRGTIEALDSNGISLGIYGINTTGAGGNCMVQILGGQACNDAPFIGFKATGNQQIYSLVISAYSGGNTLAPVLGSLMFDPSSGDVPEPASFVLTGFGCLAVAYLGRRLARRRASQTVG